MTTLYDIPTSTHHPKDEYYNSSDSELDQEAEEGYEMAEYDLDVVDDALSNPNNTEYMDHFGFTIQVRTDDESSSDDDSNFDDDEQVKKPSTVATNTTSDDDSIDTHVTTPHHSDFNMDHHKKGEQAFDLTNMPTQAPTSVPILKSPPTPKPQDSGRQRSGTTSTSGSRSSNDTTHNNNNNRSSILSSFNNPFKARPISVTSTSTQHSPAIIPRPSQSFQQRQSKRYSEMPHHIGTTPRSPASNHKHFDKLVSKFRRFSHNDHQYDSEKHLLLKQEALAEVQIYKEKGGFENNSIDWGNVRIA
jgi:hypothetical protein